MSGPNSNNYLILAVRRHWSRGKRPSGADTAVRHRFSLKQHSALILLHAPWAPLLDLLIGAKTDALMLHAGPDCIEIWHLATHGREGGSGLLKKAALVVRRAVP